MENLKTNQPSKKQDLEIKEGDEEGYEPKESLSIDTNNIEDISFKECLKITNGSFHVELYSSSLRADELAGLFLQLKEEIVERKKKTSYIN